MPTDAKSRRVLVTGANGFVGTSLSAALAQAGIAVRLAVRSGQAAAEIVRRLPPVAEGSSRGAEIADAAAVGELGAGTNWNSALAGIDTVVHLAARSHVVREHLADPLPMYRSVNVEGTRWLAECAILAGVRRLVYVSSIKVNGEQTRERAYDEGDVPHPEDAYGVSKWEAEQALAEIAARGHIEVVVLRPPLLYGPGVKGNFLALTRAIARGVPLPIASVNNRRSLLYVGNLVEAIIQCMDHPAAAGKTYLLADGADISSPDLARRIGEAVGRPARLLPFPPALLKLAGAAVGRSAAISRLVGSLQVDSTKIRRELGWRPSAGIEHGLAQTAAWYHRQYDLNGPR